MSKSKGLRRPKIDVYELEKMIADGKSQSECARVFGCSRAAVHEKLKRLREGPPSLRPVKIVQVDLGVVEQMNELHSRTNALLERLSAELETGVSSMTPAELVKNEIRLLGEIRQQLKLGAEIVENLNDYRNVQEFQKLVVDVLLSEVNHETRKKIIRKLNENRAVRQSLRVSY